MSIQDSMNADLSGYEPVTNPAPAAPAPPITQDAPGPNTMLRCALPPLGNVSPDALRQFYNGNKVPQTRLLPLPTPVANSGNFTTNESVFIGGSGGGSGGGGSSTVNINSSPTDIANNTYTTTLFTKQVVLQTPQVVPGGTYIGQVFLSQSYQLLSVAASSPCRIQLYGSLAAQSADAARGLDDPCPAGTVSGLVTDLALDTTPLSWAWQNQVGSNSEDPQTNITYITVTNLSKATNVITLTIQFVPLSQGNSPNLPTVSVGNATISNSMLATWNGVAMLSGAIFSGPVQSENIISGQVDAVNITATGSAIFNDISATGNISTVDLTVTGSAAFTDISANDITTVGMNVSGSTVANDITASGNISAVDITATGSVVTNTLTASGNITVDEVISNAVNSPIVNVATSGGLQVNGTQIDSSTLSDAANIPTLSGANIFTAPLSAESLTATNSGVVSVFAGPVESASITTTDGSSTSVFAGEVQSAQFTQSGSTSNTFNGPVNMVDIVVTGGSSLVTINGFLPPVESSADATLNHVLTTPIGQNLPTVPSTSLSAVPGQSWTVTSKGVSDTFNLQAIISWNSSPATIGTEIAVVALVDGNHALAFGFGIGSLSTATTATQTLNFIGSTTGLAAGSHTISLVFWPVVGSVGISGSFPSYGLLQQISGS